MPEWLTILSLASLCVAVVCAVVVAVDLQSHPQKMWIMNIVWPTAALYAGPLALIFYFKAGRLSSNGSVMTAKERGEENPGKKKPLWQIVAIGETHCGSGCTLGDLVAEWITFKFPSRTPIRRTPFTRRMPESAASYATRLTAAKRRLWLSEQGVAALGRRGIGAQRCD